MSYKARVSEAVIRRLPMYYRNLKELEKAVVVRISSQELGERMNLTASQIRRDINCFGGFGQQGYGYHVTTLKQHIIEILGLDRQHHMIIVGAGNIGRAVANYGGFENTFKIEAMFDSSAALTGVEIGGVLVQPAEKMKDWISCHEVDIAVLSVPSACAQETAEVLAESGVRAIWNFAPVDLNLPETVAVNNVHLADSLHILSYHMYEDELFKKIDEERKL